MTPDFWGAHWADIVRTANLILTVFLLYKVNMRIVRDWGEFTRRERVVRVHLNAYLFVMGYGTVEQLAQTGNPGLRVLLVLVVHVSFAAALLRTRRDPVR